LAQATDWYFFNNCILFLTLEKNKKKSNKKKS